MRFKLWLRAPVKGAVNGLGASHPGQERERERERCVSVADASSYGRFTDRKDTQHACLN
jgi:hypothetical protein